MKKQLFSLVFLVATVVSVFAQHTTVIKHPNYTVTFNLDQCSPIMGFYVQTTEHTKLLLEAKKKKFKVDRGGFRKDALAPKACDRNFAVEYSTFNKDFVGDLQHRMDQGHINPFDAFAYEEAAAKETMLFDNVCPQISHVNEQEWRQVEGEVIDRSEAFGDVKVWTGVLISKSHPRLMGTIPIPDFYWKVIEYKKEGTKQQEAWLSVNKPENLNTKAAQAHTDVPHVTKVIHQFYPKFEPGF